MYMDNKQYDELCNILKMGNTIYKEYHWILNSYVSDFYVNKHWSSLPKPWREVLQSIEFSALADIIDCTKPVRSTVILPLSLLALRGVLKNLQIPRKQSVLLGGLTDCTLKQSLLKADSKTFWKHVKLKKKHEIEIMSQMCYKMALETKCFFVVDIGSGLGHLIRMLSYSYGLKVCGLEAQEKLTIQARNLDREFERRLHKNGIKVGETLNSTHLNVTIKTASDGADVIKILEETFGKGVTFGIVGLHPCGDLAVTLLNLFANYPQVKFINVVGCCYMKLNMSLANIGYPLSNYSRLCGYNLDYGALEVACHALEIYSTKLRSNDCEKLRIHSYRAALEKLLVQENPELMHAQVGSVKYTNNLTFSEYVSKAISKLNIKLDNSQVEKVEVDCDLKNWHDIVIFYSLRLMIAPLVETIILLDRALFINECGHNCYITSAFDPNISPRNYVISANKM